jgi:hypothetical protein
VRLQLKTDPSKCVTNSLAITKCSGLHKFGADQHRLAHRYHDATEFFWLFDGQISSGAGSHPRKHECITPTDGNFATLTQATCSGANFDYTFDRLWGTNQTVVFKEKDGSRCISADGGLSLKTCADDASQQFVVSYASDALVIDTPEEFSKFQYDQGVALTCCNDKIKQCCNKKNDYSDADYFKENGGA